MISKRNTVISLFVLISLFLSACGISPESSKPSCPTCNNPDKWSECSDDAIRTRVNFKCSEQTNYTCEEYTEQKNCMTEIQLKGRKGLEAVTSPTLDEKVKGIIIIEATSVPEGTDTLTVIFTPIGVRLGPNMAKEDLAKLVRQTDSNGADGWKVFIDTTVAENGIYTLFIGPTYDGAPDESPWLDETSTQIVIKN
jgi:hypothetical protein